MIRRLLVVLAVIAPSLVLAAPPVLDVGKLKLMSANAVVIDLKKADT